MRKDVIGMCLLLLIANTTAGSMASGEMPQIDTSCSCSQKKTIHNNLGNRTEDQDSMEYNSSEKTYLNMVTKGMGAQRMMTGTSTAGEHEYLNVTALAEDLWAESSHTRILNDTKYISNNFPNRTWDGKEMSPSISLQGAWQWANSTLMNITDSSVHFQPVTEYSHLFARFEGNGDPSRPAILITGVIECPRTPGANDMGASSAAVLEMARLLYNYSLSLDVIFVLLNGHYVESDYDAGARAFVSWLMNSGIRIATSFSFDKLLFDHSGFLHGTEIALRRDSSASHQFRWNSEIIVLMSERYGNSRVISLDNLESSRASLAYEMWRGGLPSIHIAQGRYDGLHSGSEDDVWDNPDYDYAKTGEVVKAVAASVVYMGLLKGSGSPCYYSNGLIAANDTLDEKVLLTMNGYFNTTIMWNSSESMIGYIQDETTGETVYRRVENDKVIHLKYKATSGIYRVILEYQGNDTAQYSLNITLPNDCDGDGLSDALENDLGTQLYLIDSDGDTLSDDFELIIGTNPTELDTDNDNLSDSVEYNWLSSPIEIDSDHDNLTDFCEWETGTNPSDSDSDSDGLSDWSEIQIYQTNPTNQDSDGDNLDDGFEIFYNLDPLSSDTDGDNLDDMFEVVNLMDPLSPDSDDDGWGDAYEVENCMSPTDSDTDGDGLPDGIDWNPRTHWITIAAPVSLVVIVSLFLILSALKYRAYHRE